jgi:hypothetical protein
LNDALAPLVGVPSGGVFLGPGIDGQSFDPTAAGVGTHGIIYTFVDTAGCVNSYAQCTEVSFSVGVGGSAMSMGGVHVFPNPNRGVFTVEFELDGLVSMDVTDAAGRQVHNEVFQAAGAKTIRSLDLSKLAKGHYTLKVHNAGGMTDQTVIIE